MGKIEVYIKNEKVPLIQGVSHPLDEHPCLDRNISRTESVLSDRDKLALTCVDQFASERSLPVEVYDVHTYRGRLRAFLKGIRTTPTVVVDKQRFEGKELTVEQLRKKLKSQGHQ